MPRNSFEEGYGDELDRMRARRRQKRGWELAEPFYDEDDDLQGSYLEDDEVDGAYDLEEEEMWEDLSPGMERRTPFGRKGGGHPTHSGSGKGEGRRAGGKGGARRTSGDGEAHKRGGRDKNEPPMQQKKPKKRRRGLKLFLLLLLLIAAFLYGKRWLKDRDGYWNIAVFGVDARDGNLGKGALADVQMIASINKKTGEIRLVSVYRDTYVQINSEGDFHKINEAYFKGGYEQAVGTLERNLDLAIDDYATFNWKAVVDAINVLGGVDLEITDREFAYINGFITETAESTGTYSTHLEHAGMNHLDGVQAVAYSRLRLMDTDFNRTERQRKVVSLALEKAKQADLKTLQAVAGVVFPEISTSIGVEDVLSLAKNVKRYHLGQTAGFPFAKTTADIGRLDCVIPMTLSSNVVLLHQFLYDQEGFQPSATVRDISAKIGERSGLVDWLAGKMGPVLRFLFPRLDPEHPAMRHIAVNMIANMLGLGSAATPAGLAGFKELEKAEEERRKKEDASTVQEDARLGPVRRERVDGKEMRGKRSTAVPRGTASNEMCTFLILNISSLQLIPVNIIAYRSQYGSADPAAIVGPAILATMASTLVAVVFCKIMDRGRRI